MKKIILILAALALIASSCKPIATKQYGGIYGFTEGEGEGGTAFIYPETDSTALFYLEKWVVRMNSGTLDGRITIRDGKATFRTRCDEAEYVLRFEFNGDKLTVKEDEPDRNCLFGAGVYINNTFVRTSSEIPQYYINSQGDTIYFKDFAPIENATSDNIRIIDETCLVSITDFEYLKARRERIEAEEAEEAEGDFEDTGDYAFYMGNAIGQFMKLGIESFIDTEEKDRYLSFALDNGKSHVIDLKDEKPGNVLLYKKGKKPIEIGIGWENPVGFALEEISTYLGMKQSEVMKRAGITSGMFRDSRDDKPYGFVLIGEQIWMAENLAYEAEGSKCYDHDVIKCLRYGRLYDWNVEDTKPCPAGWHLSTHDEWQTLLDYAGGYLAAGKKLKSSSSSWQDNGGGTDDYGFSALPGGFISDGGDFTEGGSRGYWWCVTGNAESGYPIWGYMMDYNGEGVGGIGENFGSMYYFSVRCVKD